jgi:hypothetical protein
MAVASRKMLVARAKGRALTTSSRAILLPPP